MAGEIEVKHTDELPKVAERLLHLLQEYSIWLFVGEMGVGKTTLIKALCAELKVTDETSSPTYSIVNEYATEHGEVVYHFDCYRMKDAEEALAIGMEEYLESGNVCFVEWPEKIANLLPEKYVVLRLEEHQGLRKIRYNHAD